MFRSDHNLPAAVKPDQIHRCVLTTLQAAAEATGDSRYRTALGIASGARGGRPANDDSALLATMSRAIAEGRAAHPTHAAWVALQESSGGRADVAAVKRLTRKYRNQTNA
jgi:hypothetical protein